MLIAAMLIAANAYCQPTTIYANSSWQGSIRGIIKFSTADLSDITSVYSKSSSYETGCYYGGKLYAGVHVDGDRHGVDHANLYSIDLESKRRSMISKSDFVYTSDYFTGYYGYTYDYEKGLLSCITGVSGSHDFVTYSILPSFKSSPLTTNTLIKNNDGGDKITPRCLAYSPTGRLYAIANDDCLYTIEDEKYCKLVGSLGVEGSSLWWLHRNSSMDFDRITGVLYWYNPKDDMLYTIDTETGHATPLGLIGMNNTIVNFIFIPFPYLDADINKEAPSKVENRKVKVTDSDVTLTWTNPTNDAQGNALTDLTAVKIFRNGVYLATISMSTENIGQTSTYTDTGLSKGIYNYTIIPINTKGVGRCDKEALKIGIGYNATAAGPVTDLKVINDNGKAVLSWAAPTAGWFEDNFDASSITGYKITVDHISDKYFQPEEITLSASETSYTYDKSYSKAAYGQYTFSVAPINALGVGSVTTSLPIYIKPDNYILMHTGEVVLEKDKTYYFRDENNCGGFDGGYVSHIYSDTLTLRPADPNYWVKVTFTSGWPQHYLWMFWGDTVDLEGGNNLFGKFDYTEDIEIESRNSGEPLTFYYNTMEDKSYSGDWCGWRARVTTREYKQHDLVAQKISGPTIAYTGEDTQYEITIYNQGLSKVDASDYKVRIVDNKGNLWKEIPGEDIASKSSVVITGAVMYPGSGYTIIHGEVAYETDEDPTNNTTENDITVKIYGKTIDPGSVEKVEMPELVVYPNPASDVININGAEVSKTELYNAAGLMVTKGTGQTLDVKALPKGIYYLRVTTASDFVQTLKVVKK